MGLKLSLLRLAGSIQVLVLEAQEVVKFIEGLSYQM